MICALVYRRCEVRKIPLTPPFDYAQGMLFQRGEVRELHGKVSAACNSPLAKNGDTGGLGLE